MLRQIQKVILSLSFLLFAAWPLEAKPRLFAIIVVDQLGSELFQRHAADYHHGFKTLLDKGTVYTQASYLHVPTETAVGHATIATGQSPSIHGIIGNEWFYRDKNKTIESITISTSVLGPTNLAAPTIADALKASSPASKVISIAGKNRSAILMAGQKPDAVMWFDWVNYKWISSSYYGTPPAFLETFNSKNRPPKSYSYLMSSRFDQALINLVDQAVKTYQLGQDADPDLLLISLSATDVLGHNKGPDHPDIKKQLAFLDEALERIFSLLQNASNGEYDVAFTSDHGVLPIPEGDMGQKIGAKRVMLKSLQTDLEKRMKKRFGPAKPGWIVAFESPHLYLNWTAAKSLNMSSHTFLAEATSVAGRCEGVAQVYIPGEWEPSDAFTETYKRSYFEGRGGDLLVRFKPGVYVTTKKDGTGHGSPYDYDSQVPMIFYGKDFRPKKDYSPKMIEELASHVAAALEIPWQKP